MKDRWEDMCPMAQARALVFDQTLEHEEHERLKALCNVSPFG